jgi:predicted HTH domain antitoxin
MNTATLQVPESAFYTIQSLAEIKKLDLESVVPALIQSGATEEALGLYREGKISLNQVANVLNISVWEAIDLCERRGVALQMGRLRHDCGV